MGNIDIAHIAREGTGAFEPQSLCRLGNCVWTIGCPTAGYIQRLQGLPIGTVIILYSDLITDSSSASFRFKGQRFGETVDDKFIGGPCPRHRKFAGMLYGVAMARFSLYAHADAVRYALDGVGVVFGGGSSDGGLADSDYPHGIGAITVVYQGGDGGVGDSVGNGDVGSRAIVIYGSGCQQHGIVNNTFRRGSEAHERLLPLNMVSAFLYEDGLTEGGGLMRLIAGVGCREGYVAATRGGKTAHAVFAHG